MSIAELLRLSWRSWFQQDQGPVGPAWLQWVWTFVFCLFMAAVFTIVGFLAFARGAGAWRNLAGWWHWYQMNLLVSLCVGYSIHLLFAGTTRLIGACRIRALAGWRRVAFHAGVPVVGVAIGWPLGLWLIGEQVTRWFSFDQPNVLIGSVLLSGLITFVLYQFFDIKARQIRAESQATEAQLKLLQGQIEPHFLFNTLANVVGLMESDTPRAKAMLESFVEYLRASLGGLRQEQRTLGDEADLVEAYLRIVAMRMDERLNYRLDVPADLRDLALPALTLQPLVENAIVHGLEPKVDGGRVDIVARRDGPRLVLTVQDNGLGVHAPAGRPGNGTGTALSNIRERLRQRFGPDAELRIDSIAPHGVRAWLSLPAVNAAV